MLRACAAPRRCRCIATSSAKASGPWNVPSTVAWDFFTIRPCSSCTKIVATFGSRHWGANVRRDRFRECRASLSCKPSASVASGIGTTLRNSSRSRVRPPSICTDTRRPASSLPAGNVPARNCCNSRVRKCNRPSPHCPAIRLTVLVSRVRRRVPVPAARTDTTDKGPLACATLLCNPGVQPLPKRPAPTPRTHRGPFCPCHARAHGEEHNTMT